MRQAASVLRTVIMAALIAGFCLGITSWESDAVEKHVTLSYLHRDIYIDGKLVNNYELTTPILSGSDGAYYVPLTDLMLQALGFQTEPEPRGLILRVVEAGKYGAADEGVNTHFDCEDIDAVTDPDFMLTVLRGDEENFAEERLDYNSVYFAEDGTIYVSLRALAACSPACITFYYEDYTGLYVSTDPQIHAARYYSAENRAFVETAIRYMQDSCYQTDLSYETAKEYEFLFRRASKIYGVSEVLLMATCKAESSFWIGDISRAGACGLMQIMPSSARGYGITREQLFDPMTNIDFGAMYIRDRIGYYKGDETKALSAYNQGMGRVNSGNYSTGYANTVFRHRTNILRLLEEAGADTEFRTELWPTK